jgi:hypothetical protein
MEREEQNKEKAVFSVLQENNEIWNDEKLMM